ncbi:hypothetical protein SAMN05660330_03760 [Desulforhopalus singaporensis]|uniref:Uncharacterized protein n=2 Tax=Desulforhopalus singaporensis TaxID=91360 RepID=A0A1H0UWA8_9BACT|nr:hypothetical protein SAMN05660330_03760 [Desulforhopalus singaporensis]
MENALTVIPKEKSPLTAINELGPRDNGNVQKTTRNIILDQCNGKVNYHLIRALLKIILVQQRFIFATYRQPGAVVIPDVCSQRPTPPRHVFRSGMLSNGCRAAAHTAKRVCRSTLNHLRSETFFTGALKVFFETAVWIVVTLGCVYAFLYQLAEYGW